MSAYYRELVAGHEVVHAWDAMQQRPLVVMSRPGTTNDAAYFTADEARRLASVLNAAADEVDVSAHYRELVAGHDVVHDWAAMQRPFVVMSRPGTTNDAAYFTADEARRLASVLNAAADEAER